MLVTIVPWVCALQGECGCDETTHEGRGKGYWLGVRESVVDLQFFMYVYKLINNYD